jgi:hypothetical protein
MLPLHMHFTFLGVGRWLYDRNCVACSPAVITILTQILTNALQATEVVNKTASPRCEGTTAAARLDTTQAPMAQIV